MQVGICPECGHDIDVANLHGSGASKYLTFEAASDRIAALERERDEARAEVGQQAERIRILETKVDRLRASKVRKVLTRQDGQERKRLLSDIERLNILHERAKNFAAGWEIKWSEARAECDQARAEVERLKRMIVQMACPATDDRARLRDLLRLVRPYVFAYDRKKLVADIDAALAEGGEE